MKLVPAVTVSGTVSAPAGQGSFLEPSARAGERRRLRLRRPGGIFARTVSDPAGTFAFLGVPAGQYADQEPGTTRGPLRAASVTAALDDTSLWAATPVTVGDKDLANLSIAMRPGIRVTGRVDFSGSRAAPAAR